MNQTLKTILIVFGVLVVTFGCLGGFGYFGVYAPIVTTGNGYETTLSGQYRACQLVYSTFTAGFKEQFGVYTANLKGIDTYMSDAIKGRYDTKDASGTPTGTIDANLFIKAIAEAYPDVSGINGLASKLMDYVQSQRADFRDCQTKLVDMDQQFRNWRINPPQNILTGSVLPYPDRNLIAQVGTQKLYGQQAEDKMMELVLTSDAIQAYQSGQDVPQLTPVAP